MKGAFMFNLKDKVVYPGHGVAIIDEVIKKHVGGKEISFFRLDFIYKDMTILLPVNNMSGCGVRFPSDKLQIKKVFDQLYKKPDKKLEYLDFTPSGWNRRNKDYQLKIQSGSITDISYVYRDLMCVAQQKELSFGERKLLMLAEDLLCQEIQVVTSQTQSSVLDQLHAPFKQFLFQQANIKQFSSAV
ncbi:hypothetical protein GF385_03135 [Candidatus Dependentiae bacterium]|nr:hypothetical protein [Candidatus Dependentiae bacterium]